MTRGKRNPAYEGLAGRLKRARQAAGLLPTVLSEAAGLSRPTVHNIEQGRVPRLDVAERLARAVGLDPGFLCFGVYGTEVFRDKIPRDEQIRQEPQPAPAAEPPAAPLLCEQVGERLRLARERRGLSRAALGRATRRAHSAIGYVEEGRTAPSVATIEALAKALEVSPCWLGFGVGKGPGED